MKLLNGLSRSEFLQQHWQKKPLLIQQGIPKFKCPISKQQLFELACNEIVESRLIIEDIKENSWQCEYGPFEIDNFKQLSNDNWTLLVQSVDHYHKEIALLLDLFDFIPNWRIDDIMISYAVNGGNVGPHLDQYDVFLLQAYGERHWHINEIGYSDDDFIEDHELKILSEFESEQDWILKPGDILYLPPGVAHHGIAKGECITISIGFRAPNDHELLSAFVDDISMNPSSFFYTDPELELQNHSGEIKKHHIEYIHQMMLSRIVHDDEFEQWFGRFITDNRTFDEIDISEINFEDFDVLYKQQSKLTRYGNVRVSYIQQQDHVDLFIAGQHESLKLNELELVQFLSKSRELLYENVLELSNSEQALNLLHSFYQQGFYYFEDESTFSD